MFGSGIKAYTNVSVETDTLQADPHRLILMLFDGAIHCINRGKYFLAQKDIPRKCEALSQACRIVDSGLKVSVDPGVSPDFGNRLISLYQYILMRLLQANLRNDVAAMDESLRLLNGLRSAWLQIAPNVGAVGHTDQEPVQTVAKAPLRKELAAYQFC